MHKSVNCKPTQKVDLYRSIITSCEDPCNNGVKLQVITCPNEKLDKNANVYIIDLDPSITCAQYMFGKGSIGDTKMIAFKEGMHVMFYNKHPYNSVSEIHFHRPGQAVTMEYLPEVGWTVIGYNGVEQSHASHWDVPEIITFRGNRPNYLYIMSTARRMPFADGKEQNSAQDGTLGQFRRDYLTVVDINPMSATYNQIVDRVYTNPSNVEPDELHHGHILHNRQYVIAPGLSSSAINIFSLRRSERHPKLVVRIEPEEVYKLGVSNLHTTHEFTHSWGEDIVISALSNRTSEANGRGNGPNGGFIMMKNSFEPPLSGFIKPTLTEMPYNYDFSLRECLGVFISTEWTSYGGDYGFDKGFFDPTQTGLVETYGHKITVWNIMTKEHIQTIDLRIGSPDQQSGIAKVPNSGEIPLEIRFLHREMQRIGIISCVSGLAPDPSNKVTGLKLDGGTIVAVYCPPGAETTGPNWKVKQVAFIPTWNGMIPAITDITLSTDEKTLYASCWAQGRLVQFDLTKVQDVIDGKLKGLPVLSDVWLGGLVAAPTPGHHIPDDNGNTKYHTDVVTEMNHKPLTGGPQMLRLSADNETLYVTNSLYSAWDDQFYGTSGPKSIHENGGWLMKINTGFRNGKRCKPMKVDRTFFIDFGNEPDGPTRAHEIHRYGMDH